MKSGNEHLLLKWGTLKGWSFPNNEKAMSLLKEYHEIGASYSAMMQNDTARQKEIILELIDACSGNVQNDWTGEVYDDKEKAKKYILEFKHR